MIHTEFVTQQCVGMSIKQTVTGETKTQSLLLLFRAEERVRLTEGVRNPGVAVYAPYIFFQVCMGGVSGYSQGFVYICDNDIHGRHYETLSILKSYSNAFDLNTLY